MTDVRERVARAICRQNLISTRQPDDAETMEHYWKSFLAEADAALSALGWREMEDAMEWYARGGGVAESADDVARGDVDLARASEALTEDCGDRARAALRKARGET